MNDARYWIVGEQLHCRHGVILYGDSCVQCERGEVPEAVEDQRPRLLGVDAGARLSVVILEGPDQGKTATFATEFLRSFTEAAREALNLPYGEFIRRYAVMYRDLGEPYMPLAETYCPVCGLTYEECNRRMRAQLDKERFQKFERDVARIQEEAEIRRAINDAIADGELEGDFGIFDPADGSWVEPSPPLVEHALAGWVDSEEEAGRWSEAEATRIALLLDEPGKLQVRRLFVLGRNC